jgi:hypothetical protein
LWADFPDKNNAVGMALEWAGKQGFDLVRLVDSFNLGRRMAWVRGNLGAFPTIGATAAGFGGAAPTSPEGGPGPVTTPPPGLPLEANNMKPSSAPDGSWHARTPNGELITLSIRRVPGASAPLFKVARAGKITAAEADLLTLIGNAEAAGEPK